MIPGATVDRKACMRWVKWSSGAWQTEHGQSGMPSGALLACADYSIESDPIRLETIRAQLLEQRKSTYPVTSSLTSTDGCVEAGQVR